MDDIIAEQGWTQNTVLELLRRFLSQNGLDDKATEFLKGVADEENLEREEI